jgi:hypothetical protein
MIHQTPNGATTFGYLSAVQSPEHGYFGGYLLVSLLGRPVEFHCTAPIQPSRAQEILYGPTLQPYLLGEQIAGTLLTKAQTRPQIILTDQATVLCHRAKLSVPLVHLHRPDCNAGASTAYPLLVSGHVIELAPGYESDRDAAIALLTTLAQHVELAEPFDRIHEAIREAQRISQGNDAHGEAA